MKEAYTAETGRDWASVQPKVGVRHEPLYGGELVILLT